MYCWVLRYDLHHQSNQEVFEKRVKMFLLKQIELEVHHESKFLFISNGKIKGGLLQRKLCFASNFSPKNWVQVHMGPMKSDH